MAKELFTTALSNDANLQAYYRYEGNSNDSKNANNGTDTSMSYSTSNGMFGQGSNFSGSGNIAVADTATLRWLGTTDYTIHFWGKLTALSGTQVFASKWAGTNNSRDWIVYAVGGTLTINGLGGSAISIAGGVPDTSFHMYDVILKNNGTLVAVYRDAISINGASNFGTTTTQATFPTFYHGCNNDGAGPINNMTGSLDEMSIFNRQLTQAEIQNLFVTAGGSAVWAFM